MLSQGKDALCGRSWYHTLEPHRTRYLFSPETDPRFQRSTSTDPNEKPVGTEACVPRAGSGRNRSVMGAILLQYRDVQ